MKWKIIHKLDKIPKGKQGKVDSIIELLLIQRGLASKKDQKEFLQPSLDDLHKDFFDKNELVTAFDRIQKAIVNNEQIVIYSDYDVDGITGGCILWETLDSMRARVMPYVPHRIEEGYGISKKGIDNILGLYPDTKLIITVDHGVTAVNEVAYAKEKGLDVIITDHHTVGKKMPKAYAIIHTTKLAGSGVAYIFSNAIRHSERSRAKRDAVEESHTSHTVSGMRSFVASSPQDDRNEHLGLAAIGAIGDLVPLKEANRVIVTFGLEALQKTKRIGLTVLFDEIGLKNKYIGTYEIGFMIAPRINASGRLTHALDALRLLCTKSTKRARELAKSLNQTNVDRQTMMNVSNEHAKSLVSSEKKLLFIADESYHEGIIGLVAGKLVEEYYRPAIVIAKGKKFSKASARSILGFNIIEALRAHSYLLINAGGHPMAAGFTVETEKLPELEEKLRLYVEENLDDKLLNREITIDMEIEFEYLSRDLYTKIQQLAPFGVGNHEPLFVTKNVTVLSASPVGNNGEHLKMILQKGKSMFETIGFRKGYLYNFLSSDKKISIAYTLSNNSWNNQEKLQLKLRDIQV
jgi:single-stranded-DNA-specific exonuclease